MFRSNKRRPNSPPLETQSATQPSIFLTGAASWYTRARPLPRRRPGALEKAERLANDTTGCFIRQDTQGTYLLKIALEQPAELIVGRLGSFAFQAGCYAYAGSALGPGGVQARLARHARAQKKIHWHIDYLLQRSHLLESWHVACRTRLECTWAAALSQLPGAQIPVPGFGASDCRCPGHLIYWTNHPEKCQIEEALRVASPTGCDLRHILYTR
jgi:Uri superfamily endonuclease